MRRVLNQAQVQLLRQSFVFSAGRICVPQLRQLPFGLPRVLSTSSTSAPVNLEAADLDQRPEATGGRRTERQRRDEIAANMASQASEKEEKEFASNQPSGEYTLPHPLWKNEYIDHVELTHKEPEDLVDKLAMYCVRIMRFNFDVMSGYKFGTHTPNLWLNRFLFLETVAGVPGSIAATLRHLASLRRLRRDHGWIHTLLEEAENERMHLLTFLQMRNPGKGFRAAIWVTQGIFFNFFWLAYIVNPRFCHRFVGYLEEEATKTYTTCLKEIDGGPLQHWKTMPAPEIAINYWKMKPGSTMRDLILVVRADESHHRNVNHTFADLTAHAPESPNPFPPGH